MSKTIYLDGTETLIHTHQLIDPQYKRPCILSEWERALLELIYKASVFVGHRIVVEVPSLRSRHTEMYSVERFCHRILRELGLHHRDVCEFRMSSSHFELTIYPERRLSSEYLDFHLKDSPWKSIP